jgi:hypothetical protein
VFFLIIFIFVVPFALLTRGDNHDDLNFDSLDNWEVYKPYLTLFLGTIGEYGFALDHFEPGEEQPVISDLEAIDPEIDIQHIAQSTPATRHALINTNWCFFLLFTFFSQIIMLNLIIGIVCSVYEKANEKAESTFYAVRCIICENLLA